LHRDDALTFAGRKAKKGGERMLGCATPLWISREIQRDPARSGTGIA
jgi:hypothetical protein